VPLAFFLSANKHQTFYDHVFRYRVPKAATHDVKLCPAVVHANFETAIPKAVTTVWPSCKVKARRFNFGQSWWRKIQSLGLSKQYGKKDSEKNQFLKKIFGLSLLPQAEVGDCLRLTLYPVYRTTCGWKFCGFLLQNYIYVDSTFPPLVWSECSAPSFQATNAYESFHVHFNALFYSVHPNIFVLASELQQIHNETYIKMREVTTR
jgi:hypothetical protein